MVQERWEIPPAEFNTWSMDNLGQALKVSGSLGPEVFPYRVAVSKRSPFFRYIYDGVYKGVGTVASDSGVFIERLAVLAANDLGEVVRSREVFEGNLFQALSPNGGKKMDEWERITSTMQLPAGWRRFGYIHSHPVFDAFNTVALSLSNVPKAYGMAVTWSSSDFTSVVEPIKKGYVRDTVLGVITPVQLSFIVATQKTIEVLSKKTNETNRLLEINIELPPYRNFEEMGLVLYAGNHINRANEFVLQRLI